MIEAQIQYGKLEAISRQMGETLQRISRSTLVTQDRLFATAILTEDLQLAVQHQFEPDHLFAIKESVTHLFNYFSYDISEGDVLLVADTYRGGTKGQTLTMVAPLFYKGELVLFPVVRVQMKDLAGEYPGGVHPDAFELWQESMRVSPIKLFKEGKLQRDVLRFLLANSRTESLYESELRAMHSVLLSAQEQILSLLSLYGDQLKSSVNEIILYSQRRIESYLTKIPSTKMEGNVSFAANGQQLTIQVLIEKTGMNQLKIDFSGTAPQVTAPLNSSFTSTKAYAVWSFLAPLAEEVTINEGVISPFVIQATEGSLVRPKFPAATGLSSTLTGHFISSAITQTLRNHRVPSEFSPSINGPGPQVVFYSPIGKTVENEPVFLVPGYPEAKEGWGPSGLFGQRQLASAEELELYYGFQMIKREVNEDGQMAVRLLNKGDDYYVTTVVPEDEDFSYGSVSIFVNGEEESYTRSVADQLLKFGDQIELIYSREKGDEGDER